MIHFAEREGETVGVGQILVRRQYSRREQGTRLERD